MNGASVFGEETAFIGVGLENNWGRSNGMIGTYPIGGPRWPILGVSPTSFVRPTPKQWETYLAGYIREPRSERPSTSYKCFAGQKMPGQAWHDLRAAPRGR